MATRKVYNHASHMHRAKLYYSSFFQTLLLCLICQLITGVTMEVTEVASAEDATRIVESSQQPGCSLRADQEVICLSTENRKPLLPQHPTGENEVEDLDRGTDNILDTEGPIKPTPASATPGEGLPKKPPTSSRFKSGLRSLKGWFRSLPSRFKELLRQLKAKIQETWPSKKRSRPHNGQEYEQLTPTETQQHGTEDITNNPQHIKQYASTSDYLYPSKEATVDEILKKLDDKRIVYQYPDRFEWTHFDDLPGYYKTDGCIKTGKDTKKSLFRAFAQIKYHDQNKYVTVEEDMIKHEIQRFAKYIENHAWEEEEKNQRVLEHESSLRRGEWGKGVRVGCFAEQSQINLVVLFKSSKSNSMHIQLYKHNAWADQFKGLIVEDGVPELLWHTPGKPLPLTQSVSSTSFPQPTLQSPSASSTPSRSISFQSPENSPKTSKV